MADDSNSVPTIPGNTNWSEWTFEQALAAITGEGADLHSAAQATWHNFNTSPGAGDSLSYHAFGEYYFGVNFNTDAQQKWFQAFDTIDGMMNDISRGKRGEMDLQTLRDLERAINGMAVWTDGTAAGMHSWSNALNQEGSAFRGKAAFIIQWRLKASGDGLVDTHEQLTTRHGLRIGDAVGSAANALEAFNTAMVNAWHGFNGLRNTVIDHINFETKAAFDYMQWRGIFLGTPNYYLDSVSTDDAKAYIKRVMSEYPQFGGPGALNTADGWAAISRKVSNDVTNYLKGWLDPAAQTAIGTLQPVYLKATSALVEITAPPKETPPSPDPNKNGDGGGGDDTNLPPPPGGGDGGGNDANIPPPPGGGDGGGDDANIPPPPGGGDGGGSDANIPPPGGGADGGGSDFGLDGPPGSGADGGGDPGLDGPPGGGADGGGNNAFVPNLVPPPGGGLGPDADGGGSKSGAGPGSDGAFDETGGGDGVIGPPGGADGGGADGGGAGSLLPPDTGTSGTHLPPGADGGGAAGGAGGGADGGGGFDIGDGSNGGGFGSDPGKGAGTSGAGGGGFGGVGLGPGGLGSGSVGGGAGSGFDIGSGGGPGGLGGGLGGGVGAGAGAGGGLGGGDGSLPTTMQASGGGAPGAPGSPGTSGGNAGGDGGGGVPFFPPMMGGAGAGGGDKPQERERQTWLSEDEEIWGTSVDIGSGVIGRLEEEEFELDEAALVGPVRGQRRGDTPRRPRPADKEPAREAESTGEEASGAASAT